ncbi:MULTISPECIES: T7SS effector LXG polymorphic toxin [Bacillus]|uniref:T7SS effector LXG polymorphic toxin n=1 Tax=Bacillus TaxID=1386 RepID=UPI00031D20AD|nr:MULTISPECIES: T7SS effector LXG polymorphic toxin [Bacillus]
MKLLDVDVLHAGIDEILQRLSTQAEQMKRVESAVKGVVNLSDSFTGMGGQAILSYYQNDHLTFLASYQTFLSNYTNTLKQMKVAIQTLEPSANGFIRQSYLESELERGLSQTSMVTAQLTNEANSIIQSVQDIVSLPRFEDASFQRDVIQSRDFKNVTINRLEEMDHQQNRKLDSIEEAITEFSSKIKSLDAKFISQVSPLTTSLQSIDDLVIDETYYTTLTKDKRWYEVVGDAIIGVIEGVLKAVWDIVEGLFTLLKDLFTNPGETFKSLYNMVRHPVVTAKAVWESVESVWERDVVHGDARSRAAFFSYALTNVALTIGTGGAGGAAKGASATSKMSSAAAKLRGKTITSPIPHNAFRTDKLKGLLKNGVVQDIQKAAQSKLDLLRGSIGKLAVDVKSFANKTTNVLHQAKNVLNPLPLVKALQSKLKTSITTNLSKTQAWLNKRIESMKEIKLFPIRGEEYALAGVGKSAPGWYTVSDGIDAFKRAGDTVVRIVGGTEKKDVKHVSGERVGVENKGTTKPLQKHHYATNKSKKYTPQMENITKKYGLDLDEEWNKELLPHQGRHPNAYHDYVLGKLSTYDRLAKGDREKFLKLYEGLKQEVRDNPDMLYKEYWRSK